MLRALLIRFFPALASRVEKESREWMVQCKNCEGEVSVWEAGGMRYKARGTVRRWGKCPLCGIRSMLRIYRRNRQAHEE